MSRPDHVSKLRLLYELEVMAAMINQPLNYIENFWLSLVTPLNILQLGPYLFNSTEKRLNNKAGWRALLSKKRRSYMTSSSEMLTRPQSSSHAPKSPPCRAVCIVLRRRLGMSQSEMWGRSYEIRRVPHNWNLPRVYTGTGTKAWLTRKSKDIYPCHQAESNRIRSNHE